MLNTTAQTFTNPQMEATLWNYLMFRQTPLPLGSTDMMVFVRKDIRATLPLHPVPTSTEHRRATFRYSQPAAANRWQLLA